MNRTTLLVTALAIGTTLGCGKKSDNSKDTDKAAATPAPNPAEVAAPDEPAAPEYTEAAAKQLVDELAGCTSAYSCDALTTLISFGPKVSAALAEIATDASKTKDLRSIALHGLTEIKDPAVGMRLFEAGKTEQEFILRGDLFKAAGASGGAETFAAMAADYASDASKEYRTELGFGVKSFDKAMVFEYASSNYPDAEPQQIRFADLIRDAATDAAAVQPLLDKTKDPMARHRLASAMVALGDASKLDILIKGFSSKSEYDRSDAANMLAAVVDKIPEDRKAEIIDLVTKAKAGDKGGLTSVGYDKILKALAK